MRVNWNEKEEPGPSFIEGQRYQLVIKEAQEGASQEKLTPFLKLIFVTAQEGEQAWDKTLWMTPKALYRAQEWFEAMGLVAEGDYDLNIDTLAGISLTAACSFRIWKDPEGKEHKAVEWISPKKVVVGILPANGAGKMAPKTVPKPEVSAEDVPF